MSTQDSDEMEMYDALDDVGIDQSDQKAWSVRRSVIVAEDKVLGMIGGKPHIGEIGDNGERRNVERVSYAEATEFVRENDVEVDDRTVLVLTD